MIRESKFDRVHKTRFNGLGYAKICPGIWMFIDTETDAQIGYQYASKDELLSDLRAFAEGRGFIAA